MLRDKLGLICYGCALSSPQLSTKQTPQSSIQRADIPKRHPAEIPMCLRNLLPEMKFMFKIELEI